MTISVVKILKYTPHPNANKLGICEVTDGSENWQVVCGAKNAKEGLITVMAQIGDTTPTGLVIEKAEIRGVTSSGMLCSAKDLGLNTETGIVDLPPDTKLATPWEKLPREALSSTPWYKLKVVEVYYFDELTKRIHRLTPDQAQPQQSKVLSKTYFDQGKYLYRNFL